MSDLQPSPTRAVPLLNRLAFGGDYNADQWPEDVWQEDVRLMRDAGVNLVSVGIFSWSRLEPLPGLFDFDWLDRLLDLLSNNGVYVDLATPTASPPPWLARLDPTSLPVRADGARFWPGSRRHYCPHNATYRRHAASGIPDVSAASPAGNRSLGARFRMGGDVADHRVMAPKLVRDRQAHRLAQDHAVDAIRMFTPRLTTIRNRS